MIQRKYQICKCCVMDTSDADIVFDSNGVCMRCNEYKNRILPQWNYGEGHEEEERRLCWENEDMVDKLRDEMKEKHIHRLTKGECDPRAGMIYTDMVVDLERIADHATNLVGDMSGEQ